MYHKHNFDPSQVLVFRDLECDLLLFLSREIHNSLSRRRQARASQSFFPYISQVNPVFAVFACSFLPSAAKKNGKPRHEKRGKGQTSFLHRREGVRSHLAEYNFVNDRCISSLHFLTEHHLHARATSFIQNDNDI